MAGFVATECRLFSRRPRKNDQATTPKSMQRCVTHHWLLWKVCALNSPSIPALAYCCEDNMLADYSPAHHPHITKRKHFMFKCHLNGISERVKVIGVHDRPERAEEIDSLVRPNAPARIARDRKAPRIARKGIRINFVFQNFRLPLCTMPRPSCVQQGESFVQTGGASHVLSKEHAS
jgi:hypothetical protein